MANFTKQAIKASFMKLLNQKPLSKISVRDIVEDCGINRNSFYYHFQDIPSLLGEIVTEQTDELIRQYPTISSMEECFSVAFHTARENRRAVMHIFNSANRDMFLQDTMRLCEYVVLGAATATMVVLVPAVGTILSLALLVAPAAGLRCWVASPGHLLAGSALVGVVLATGGLAAAVIFDLSAGGTIAVLAGVFYVGSTVFRTLR